MSSTYGSRKKKPCRYCRKWFYPDPRVGARQVACSDPECQRKRAVEQRERWRKNNPDYFTWRRIKEKGGKEAAEEPRVKAPLNRLPWDVAQTEFGVQGTEFIAILARLLVDISQMQMLGQLIETIKERGGHGPKGHKTESRGVARM